MASSAAIIQAAQPVLADQPVPAPSQKGRHFFQMVRPTFSVSPGTTQLEFVDNSDPRKDAIVRKKAREWVFRNREVTRGKRGVTFKKHDPERQKVQQGKGNKKKEAGTTVSLFGPSSGCIDPYGLFPNVGRKVDHIIEFYHHTSHLRLHFLTSSITRMQRPEEVPGPDDQESGRLGTLTTRASNENTILGTMARERVSFILWLHATTLVKDGMNGKFGTSESMYYYRLALRAMQEEVDKATEKFSDQFLVALACFSACANFSGDYRAAKVHQEALIKAITLRGRGDLKKGLQSCEPWTQKAIIWCEIHVAAQTPSLPLLPYMPLPTEDSISREISHQSSRLTAITISHAPPLSDPFAPFINQIHQLCLLKPPPEKKKWPGYCKAVTAGTRTLYGVEYKALQLLTAQEQEVHSFTPFEVMFSNACQLFIWPAIRGLPPEMKMCDLFVQRLKKATIPLIASIRDSPASGPVEEGTPARNTTCTAPGFDLVNDSCAPIPWNTAPPPTPLLPTGPLDYPIIWALFLGTLMTTVNGRPEHSWFKEQLSWMTLARNAHVFRSAEDLEDMLKLFPYTESFCGMGIARVGLVFEHP